MRYGWRVKRPEMWLDKDGLPKYDVLNNDSIASPLKLKNQVKDNSKEKLNTPIVDEILWFNNAGTTFFTFNYPVQILPNWPGLAAHSNLKRLSSFFFFEIFRNIDMYLLV